jgi:hypothetical protein
MNTGLSSKDTKLNLMNDMSGINCRAPSGRTGFVAVISQGIARMRSALGCILAALQAAFGSCHLKNTFSLRLLAKSFVLVIPWNAS